VDIVGTHLRGFRRVLFVAAALLSMLLFAAASSAGPGDPPTVRISDATVSEGDSGTTEAVFDVAVVDALPPVVVEYATAPDSATSPEDYTTTSGTLTFATDGTQQIRVPVRGDTLDEFDESFFVNLTVTPTPSGSSDLQGRGTIADNDPLPAITVSSASAEEGGPVAFGLTLSARSGRNVVVDYTTTTGSASGADFDTTGGTVTIPAGTTTGQIPVATTEDAVDEPSETFGITITSGQATASPASATGTILDDDLAPSLSVTDESLTEDAATMSFRIRLSNPSTQTITVNAATADDSASAPSDYSATSPPLIFNPGETEKVVQVGIKEDSADESNETFFVRLSNAAPFGAVTIADPEGIGTIVDDDDPSTPGSLAIGDVTVAEGNTGTTDAVFTVTFTPGANQAYPVTVSFATQQDGSALESTDFVAHTGSVTFAAGETTKPVAVPVNGDAVDEFDETFRVNLFGASNATIADGQGVGTIGNDDPPAALTVSAASATEGNGGAVNLTFTVTLAPASGKTVSVSYSTADGSAAAPADYQSTGGALVFPAGQTTRTFVVRANGDTLDEANETFTVGLFNADNATVSTGSGVGTIIDDDGAPALTISDPTVTEGNAATVSATFTVTLAPSAGQSVSVKYATQDGSAVAPADYTAAAGTLNFTPGETSKSFTVAVKGDATDELDETFRAMLSDAVNAEVADGEGTATIVDDDASPSLRIDDATLSEATVGLVFDVRLSSASGRTTTVAFATENGFQAKAPDDFAQTSGTLTFAPGQTSRTISVPIVGDSVCEADETFSVRLTSPAGATLADGVAAGKIVDDDSCPDTRPPLPTPTSNGGAGGGGSGDGDVCPNIPGTQTRVPNGFMKDGSGDCVAAPQADNDICLNIPGVQTSLPAGYLRDPNGDCILQNPPPPPRAPNPGPNTGTRPTVQTKLAIALSRRSFASNRDGFLSLGLRCPRTARSTCSGTVTIKADLRRVKRGKPRLTRLGLEEFVVASGRSELILFPLSRAGRKALTQVSRLSAEASFSFRDEGGKRQSNIVKFTLVGSKKPAKRT